MNLQDVNVGRYRTGVWEDWPRTTHFVAQLETDIGGFFQVARFEDGDGFVEFAPVEARGVVGRHGGCSMCVVVCVDGCGYRRIAVE